MFIRLALKSEFGEKFAEMINRRLRPDATSFKISVSGTTQNAKNIFGQKMKMKIGAHKSQAWDQVRQEGLMKISLGLFPQQKMFTHSINAKRLMIANH